MDLGDLSYLYLNNYDRSLASWFSPTPSAVYKNMQIAMTEVLRGVSLDRSVNDRLSWDSMRVKLNGTHQAVRVFSQHDEGRLRSALREENQSILVGLVADEYVKQFATLLRIHTHRCYHKGVLHLLVNKHHVFLLDRRVAWFLLPSAVGVVCGVECRMWCGTTRVM